LLLLLLFDRQSYCMWMILMAHHLPVLHTIVVVLPS
jgi:hypothetical protein